MRATLANQLKQLRSLDDGIKAKYRARVERKGYYDNGDYLEMIQELKDAGLPALGVVVEEFLESCGPRK